MARFYFHLTNGDTIKDDEGEPYATAEQARAHAEKVARELARNRTHNELRRRALCVTDEAGRQVVRIPLCRRRCKR
jgi:hypothetical protein